MSTFQSLVIGSNTFIPTAPGYYSLSTRGFSDPRNQIKISGGKFNAKTGRVTAAVSRLWETDTTVAGLPVRSAAEVAIIMTVGRGITATNADVLLSDLNTLLDPARLDQILQGGF